MRGRGVIGTVGRVVTLENSVCPSTEGGGAPSGGEGREGRTRGDGEERFVPVTLAFQHPACPLLVP